LGNIWIRILQKGTDPTGSGFGSGSSTLTIIYIWVRKFQ